MKPVKIAMMALTHGHTRKYYQTLRDNSKLDWVASCAADQRAKDVYELYNNGVPCYLSAEEMFAKHPDIEAVVIASANDQHLKEMKIISGLEYDPAFCPVVADFYSGMETIIPLFKSQLRGTVKDIEKVYQDLYQGPVVKYESFAKDGMISAAAMKSRDDLLIHVEGNEDRILLTAVFDNLGKGASGAAIQNMNIVMGIDETAGLVTGETL